MVQQQQSLTRRRNRTHYVPVYAASLIYVFLVAYFLFQGGKTSFMLLVMATVLGCYWLATTRSGIRKVRGLRMIGGSAQSPLSAGSVIPVRLEINVPGWFPIPYVVLQDGLSRFDRPFHMEETVVTLDVKRRAYMEYRIPVQQRGCYRFIETHCKTRDLFGLFTQQGNFHNDQELYIQPQSVTIPAWPASPHWRNIHMNDQERARNYRESTQINGIRDYVHGDRLSRIHWNATARTGTWKSKQYEPEGEPPLLVVLDCFSHAYKSEEQFELAVSVVCSLANYARKHQRHVNVIGISTSLTIWPSDAVRSEALSYRKWLASVQPESTSHKSPREIQSSEAAWMSKWMSHPELQRGGIVAWVSGGGEQAQLSTVKKLSHLSMCGSYFYVGSDPGSNVDSRTQMARLGFDYVPVPELNQLPVRLGGQK